jgi:NADH dehydrogenase FAD-containing subunit
VHAVRQGKTLAAGLRAMIDGTTQPTWRPRRRSLHLLAGGDGTALATWGPVTAAGTWVSRWKDRLDRAFVAT